MINFFCAKNFAIATVNFDNKSMYTVALKTWIMSF